jgi:hypothetical protein
MAIVDGLQIKVGLNNNIPTLLEGEPLFTEDLGNGRFILGSINGNVSFPNMSDLQVMTDLINGALNTANNASSNINQALTTATNANQLSNEALTQANSTQSQVANIIANNGTGKDPELVDIQTDASGKVWDSAGDHVRNLDNNYEINKVLYTYSSTADGTISISIGNATVDLTIAHFEIKYEGETLILTDNYTINTTARTINLVGWTLDNGEKIIYRILR